MIELPVCLVIALMTLSSATIYTVQVIYTAPATFLLKAIALPVCENE